MHRLLRLAARVSVPGRDRDQPVVEGTEPGELSPRCRSVFERHRVPASCVELEIAATLMLDTERTLPLRDELRAMGMPLSIDDFGTGYSSLSALKKFPISTLKIDRSFVTNAATDPDDATIVRTIIEMAPQPGVAGHRGRYRDEEQRYFLLHSGCQLGQGRLFGDAITSEAFLELLLRQATGQHPILQMPA